MTDVAAGTGWPGGARCAVAFTFDVDAESPLLAVRPDFADRMSTMSQQAYGPEVGIPRLLRLLGDLGVRSTFFVPGYTAAGTRRPSSDRGRRPRIAHHGCLQPLTRKSVAEEAGSGSAASRRSRRW